MIHARECSGDRQMKEFYTEDQIITAVTRLSHVRLVSYIEADVIRPVQTPTGLRYREVDISRLELLCDLTEQFDLRDDALGIVISLIDQLHDARSDLRTLSDILASEPEDIRERIGRALTERRR